MPHAVEHFHFPFEQLRWLDELGVSAAMEQDIVCKQTFIGSHYAMLDAQYNPLPVSSVGKKKGLQGTKGVCICMYTLLVLPSLCYQHWVFVRSIATIVSMKSIQSGLVSIGNFWAIFLSQNVHQALEWFRCHT